MGLLNFCDTNTTEIRAVIKIQMMPDILVINAINF